MVRSSREGCFLQYLIGWLMPSHGVTESPGPRDASPTRSRAIFSLLFPHGSITVMRRGRLPGAAAPKKPNLPLPGKPQEVSRVTTTQAVSAESRVITGFSFPAAGARGRDD